MTDEILDGADVICQRLGKGERFSDQTRHPLSQCAVESLDGIGFAAVLFDDLVRLCRDDALRRLPIIGIELGMRRRPSSLGTCDYAVGESIPDLRRILKPKDDRILTAWKNA